MAAFRRARDIISTALLALAARAPAAAGQTPTVPKFAIADSPVALVGAVRPHQYLGVVGPRTAWLGSETGPAELWVHPLKLATDFRLDFRIPDYVDAVRGEDVARTVIVRPELTTIVYSHATFTVRQHILAPEREPGLLVLLDVATLRPLTVSASFRTDFQYAWPAAFGGQYAFWHADLNAFVLSESLRRRNAVIGSPWTTAANDHPAHAAPEAPSVFEIAVDTARARREFIPIAVAGGIGPRDSVVATYRRLIANAEALYREKRAAADALLERTAVLDTPDDRLDLAFAWSKINLREQYVCNPDLGCGLVAGWGPSGKSTRPGFGWFFGGDAAINSFAMDATGQWDDVAEGLRFLARYRNEAGGPNHGKIPHEISQAAAHIPWFTDYPYAYYHADTTPYWIVALWRYWRASGDEALVAELWPAVLEAYAWCLTRDTDGDGVIENGPGNLGAVEVGQLGEDIHQDIYLAAVWITALEAMSELAGARHDARRAARADSIRAAALATLNGRYWREAEGHHAFGILTSGRTNDNLTVWPATAAAFGLLDSARADRTLTKLAADAITTDWGARMLSSGSPLYDPMHYNGGAVWPFVTGFVVWGQYRYRRPWSAFSVMDALAQMTFDWGRGRHPELLSGRYYRPLDTAVPHQFFATSMLTASVMMGLLGWEPDAPRGRARLAPQLPPDWDRVTVRNLRVGATTLHVTITQDVGRLEVTVEREGPAVDLEVVLAAPPGAPRYHATIGPATDDAACRSTAGPRETRITCLHPLSDDRGTVTATWDGGLRLEPPRPELAPGQTSHGVRVLDFRREGPADGGRWTLLLEGERGATYELRLHGTPVAQATGAAIVGREGTVTTLRVALPDGSGRATTRVRLSR